MDEMRFKDLLTGAKQMRDHAAGKKVVGVREVVREVKPPPPMTKTGSVQTMPWDPVDHLKSDEDREAYLQGAIDEGDPQLLTAVRKDLERSR